MEKLHRFAFPVIVVYLWTTMILLGAVVLETFMVYPNIFHDPPASLELTMAFLAVRGPSDFFPPLGFLSWAAGLGAVALGWRTREARWWIVASLLLIVGDGLVSMAFMWPRNQIMFAEGTAVHSVETLRRTAAEFEALHWVRLGLNAAGAVSIFLGFVAFTRQRVLAQLTDGFPASGPTMREADREDGGVGRQAAVGAGAAPR